MSACGSMMGGKLMIGALGRLIESCLAVMTTREFGIAVLTQAVREVHTQLGPFWHLFGEWAKQDDGLCPLPSLSLQAHFYKVCHAQRERAHEADAPSGSLRGTALCARN